MNTLLKKLNFKDQMAIYVLNAPESFNPELSDFKNYTDVKLQIADPKDVDFLMCFVTTKVDISSFIESVGAFLQGDVSLWMCYPKQSSKKVKCEFNRDNGWDGFGQIGFEGVRQVGIDDDWSALRFRKVEFIKTITRKESFAISSEGKQRTTQKGK